MFQLGNRGRMNICRVRAGQAERAAEALRDLDLSFMAYGGDEGSGDEEEEEE